MNDTSIEGLLDSGVDLENGVAGGGSFVEEDIPLLAPTLAARDDDMLLHLEEGDEEEEGNEEGDEEESMALPVSSSLPHAMLLEEVKTTPCAGLTEDLTREEEEGGSLVSSFPTKVVEVKTAPRTMLIEDLTPNESKKLVEEVTSSESSGDVEEAPTRPLIEVVTSNEGKDGPVAIAEVPQVEVATSSEDFGVQEVSKPVAEKPSRPLIEVATSSECITASEPVEVVGLLPSADVEVTSCKDTKGQQLPGTEVYRPLIQVVTSTKDPELNAAMQDDLGCISDSADVLGLLESNPALEPSSTPAVQSTAKPTIEVASSCQDNADISNFSVMTLSSDQDSKKADRSMLWLGPERAPAPEDGKKVKSKHEASINTPVTTDQEPGLEQETFKPVIEVISSVSLDKDSGGGAEESGGADVSTLATEQPERVVNSIMKKPGRKRSNGKPKAVRFPDNAPLREEREYFPQSDEHAIPWYESDSDTPQWATIQGGEKAEEVWATMVSHEQHEEGVARSSSDEMVVEQIEDIESTSSLLLLEQEISNSPTVHTLEPSSLPKAVELNSQTGIGTLNLQLVVPKLSPAVDPSTVSDQGLPTCTVAEETPLGPLDPTQALDSNTQSLTISSLQFEATVPQHPDQEIKLSDVPLVDADMIQKVDDALRNIEGKPDAELTQEERVWRLAASGGSTLEEEAVDLDAETKARLCHTIKEVGGTDKVSLKF